MATRSWAQEKVGHKEAALGNLGTCVCEFLHMVLQWWKHTYHWTTNSSKTWAFILFYSPQSLI
jgi:hypothetical protein